MSDRLSGTARLFVERLGDGRSAVFAAGLLLTLGTVLLFLYKPSFMQRTELRLYDAMSVNRPASPTPTQPVMVGIDDESLATFGQWPWPRYRLAQLVQRLHDAGAAVVTLDTLMPEPDRTAPEIIIHERARDLQGALPQPPSPVADSNSRRLAEALTAGPSVLGCYLRFTPSETTKTDAPQTIHTDMALMIQNRSNLRLPQALGVIQSLPALTQATGAVGFTNVRHDIDGVLRRAPLIAGYQGGYLPSLALATVLRATDEHGVRLIADGADTALVWRGSVIPVDGAGNLTIRFRPGKKEYRYLSARDVLQNAIPAGSLQGKIVLVGAWARGLGDVHQTPTGTMLNGLEVHATIVDNLLSGSYIVRPDWAAGAELSAIALIGALGAWLLSRSGVMASILFLATGFSASYFSSTLLLQHYNLLLSPLFPMTCLTTQAVFVSLLKYGIEARKAHRHTLALLEAQNSIMSGMSALAEARDPETGGHILRTQSYVEVLARHLAGQPGYEELHEENIRLLVKSAPLHDIGKVGVPDRILCKPGPLSNEEFAIMKTHTSTGAQVLDNAIYQATCPESAAFLRYAREMVASHHERWDGNGYPQGLRENHIPLAGRLMALADVYDALVSTRVYKAGLSHAEAMSIICSGSGKQFDPAVVAAFQATDREFERIARQWSEERPPESTV